MPSDLLKPPTNRPIDVEKRTTCRDNFNVVNDDFDIKNHSFNRHYLPTE